MCLRMYYSSLVLFEPPGSWPTVVSAEVSNAEGVWLDAISSGTQPAALKSCGPTESLLKHI